MGRGKWVLAGVGVVAAVVGAAIIWSGHVSERLQAEGVETKAVLSASFSRAEYVGYRPHGRRYREKHTACYFDYLYVVDGREYTGKVRMKDNLFMARVGDSVAVRYLPGDPAVHQLVKDTKGRYKVSRQARRRSRY